MKKIYVSSLRKEIANADYLEKKISQQERIVEKERKRSNSLYFSDYEKIKLNNRILRLENLKEALKDTYYLIRLYFKTPSHSDKTTFIYVK